MAADLDCSESLRTAVLDAVRDSRSLQLVGHGSKAFYGRARVGDPLSVAEHSGIISYEPTELVITARGGTPLQEIEQVLSEKAQMLPFEPPHFDGKGTIGGAIASGLSGPRRPWGGAPRDLLLGVKLLDGRGQILRFGGQVMKNVAGYDLSRLMAGAMGTLGILLEVSIKVLPKPPREHTLMLPPGSWTGAWPRLHKIMIEGIPVTASYSNGQQHKLRVACSEERVKQIQQDHAVEAVDHKIEFWQALRDQQLDFFKQTGPLWRLSLPPAANIDSRESMLCEWSGGLRWLVSERPDSEIRSMVEKESGHAILFRNGDPDGEIFHPLHPRLADMQKRLKQVFDPEGVFNPGRHYPNY